MKRRQDDAAVTDWAQWSREAGAMMQARNDEWPKRLGVERPAYHWDLQTAKIRFTSGDNVVVAELCLVGTMRKDEDEFLWGWADPNMPEIATCLSKLVRDFGTTNDLPLLTTPKLDGGHPQALEAVCMAGRVLDAEGVFIDRTNEVGLYFTLHSLQRMQ